MNLNLSDSDTFIKTNIKNALESLTGIGIGNVSVTGSKLAGIQIEFINDRSGQDLSSLIVETIVTDSQKVTSFDIELSAKTTGISEKLNLHISTQTGGKGTYTLIYGGSKVNFVRFTQNDVTSNARYIKEGLEKLKKIGSGNVSVVFDQSSTTLEQDYIITFKNLRAKTNLSAISVDNTKLSTGTKVSISNLVQGSKAQGEIQEVRVASSYNGSFKLILTHGGQDYTTSLISKNAGASGVKSAINTAISSLGASVDVKDISSGVWQVEFKDSLISVNVSELKIETYIENESVSTETASKGSTLVKNITTYYQVKFGNQTSAKIAFQNSNPSSDAVANASSLQKALEAISTIGKGNVEVTVNGAATNSAQNFKITFKNGLSSKNLVELVETNASEFPQTIQITSINDGAFSIGETQRVSASSTSGGTFRLSLDHDNQSYETLDLSFNISVTKLQQELNKALLGSGGEVTVTKVSSGNWDVSFTKALAGKNIDLLKIKTSVTTTNASIGSTQVGETITESANGKFVLEFENTKSAAIEYAGSDTATTANRIQSALEALSSIGKNNVKVTYDTNSSISDQKYIVEFVDALKEKNFDQMKVNAKGLDGATIAMTTVTNGQTPQSEVQTLKIVTKTKGHYQLEFNFGGKVYKTANISFDADKKVVQTSLNSAIKDTKGSVLVTDNIDGGFNITFRGALNGKDVNFLVVKTEVETQAPSLLIDVLGSTNITSETTETTSSEEVSTTVETVLEYPANFVVDYLAKSLDILNGPSSTITLDMDGARGNLISAGATFDVDVFNFFQLNGDFAFEKYEGEVSLSDGSKKQVDILTLGGKGVSAFAGLDGGTANELGFELSGVDFGLAIVNDQADSSLKWTSLQATATAASFVGLGDDFTISSDDLAVEINIKDKNGLVIDYLADSLAVKISNTETIEFDMDGLRLEQYSISGNLNINVYNFFQVSGGFALNKYTETVTLSDGNDVIVDLMTLGASGVSAFVGMNGGSSDQIGFDVDSADFVLSILKEKDGAKRKWTSLYSTIDGASFVGIEELTIEATDLVVEINKEASDKTVVDFKAKNLEVKTSTTTSLTLDMDGQKLEYLRVRGNLNINVNDFFIINGGFAFSKSTETVTLSDKSQTTV
ncbi:hypothetical protein MJH12_02620, partial [bacterium]|nr:hypothetical protein [bacterium]